MAIVVLLLWLATAAAGVTLLRAGNEARRIAQAAAIPQPVAAGHVGAVPLTMAGLPPPGPHVRVRTPAGEHPLLEFTHPALAVTGIACWMMFTFVHYRPLAWIAFAILVTTVLAGLGWLLRSHADRAAAASPGSEAPAGASTAAGQAGPWSFPVRLAWLHGGVAALSLLLTVLTAITAARG